MARKLSKAGSKAAEAKAAGADDLAIMRPNQHPKIAGRTVTVHEYGFEEGLRLERTVLPIIVALNDDVKAGRTSNDDIMCVLSDHASLVIHLIAEACVDVPEGDYDLDARAEHVAEFKAWIKSKEVDEADGHLLKMTWWAVNGPFFLRRVMERRAVATIRAELAARGKSSAGRTSTPASSNTTPSGTSTTSAGTPVDS